jgi:hypothetical protein
MYLFTGDVPMVSYRNKNNICQTASRNTGFTIAELLVACFITSTALLGVYTIFKQVIDIERQTRVRWNNLGAAESVVTHLAKELQNCINVPQIPTLVGRSDAIICLVVGKGYDGGRFEQAGILRHHFFWESGIVSQQTLKYAGSKNITPIVGLEDMDEEQLWSNIPIQTIGKNIDSISFSYKTANDPSASWQDSWKGAVGNVAIWIRVSSKEQLSERIVVPRVNVSIDSKEGS